MIWAVASADGRFASRLVGRVRPLPGRVAEVRLEPVEAVGQRDVGRVIDDEHVVERRDRRSKLVTQAGVVEARGTCWGRSRRGIAGARG